MSVERLSGTQEQFNIAKPDTECFVPKPFSWGAAALLLGIWSNQAWCETPTAVTACELFANPQKYDGHLVAFRAQAEGDWFEGSSLGDLRCRNAGIALTSAGENANKPALERLVESVRHASHISTKDSLKVVFVTMIGQFVYRQSGLEKYLLAPMDAREIVVRPGRSLLPAPPPFRKPAKSDANAADAPPR
jgi:hypothetical protein